ncbi:MAG: prolipoprotein diacylglyceryl transferase, partial [Lachnospiraceae bacterium]
YKDDVWQVFNIRGGGLAIYGGIIAAVITLIVFTKLKRLSFFKMADCSVVGLITGQIIGRWGNLFNCEAFGGYTDNVLAMQIKRSLVSRNMISPDLDAYLAENPIIRNGVEYIQVHPTFLYESIWNICVLIFMILYRKHKKFDGEIMWIYFLGYGIGRFWIEGLRTDQLMFFHTSVAVSQALSAVLIVVSAIVIFLGRKRAKEIVE